MTKWIPRLLVAGIIIITFLWIVHILTFPKAGSIIGVLFVGLMVWIMFDKSER